MRKFIPLSWLAAVLAATLGARADDPAKPADPPPAVEPEPAEPTAKPGPITPDPIFDKQVSIGELVVAVHNQDANLMADIAVQLAAAEKMYARTHRSGVKADALFASALRMAASRREEETLKRLAVLAEARKDTATLERLEALVGTVKASRAADPLPALLEKLPEEKRLEVLTLAAEIRRAVLAHDPDALPVIDKQIADLKELPPAVVAALKEQVKQAKATVAKPADETEEVLSKLGGSSRGGPVIEPQHWGDVSGRSFGGQTYYTYVVVMTEATLTQPHMLKAVQAGEDYCTKHNKSKPINFPAKTFLARSTALQHVVVGCVCPKTKFHMWIAGTYGGNYGQYLRQTGGALNPGIRVESFAYVRYYTDASQYKPQTSDGTWARYRKQDVHTGANVTLAISANPDQHMDIYIVGPN